MKKTLTITGLFLLFLLTGGLFTSVVRILPSGWPRAAAVLVLGFAFVAVFFTLLITRLREMLAGKGKIWVHLLFTTGKVLILIVGFAGAYQGLGILDNSGEGTRVTHNFLTSLYYSVVTFTTLGYGDFYPQGIARALAALEALTGYIVLGILASSGVSLLNPHTQAGQLDE
jgi:voltage-gated potassium channel Kch